MCLLKILAIYGSLSVLHKYQVETHFVVSPRWSIDEHSQSVKKTKKTWLDILQTRQEDTALNWAVTSGECIEEISVHWEYLCHTENRLIPNTTKGKEQQVRLLKNKELYFNLNKIVRLMCETLKPIPLDSEALCIGELKNPKILALFYLIIDGGL